jgi:hypothetical protein
MWFGPQCGGHHSRTRSCAACQPPKPGAGCETELLLPRWTMIGVVFAALWFDPGEWACATIGVLRASTPARVNLRMRISRPPATRVRRRVDNGSRAIFCPGVVNVFAGFQRHATAPRHRPDALAAQLILPSVTVSDAVPPRPAAPVHPRAPETRRLSCRPWSQRTTAQRRRSRGSPPRSRSRLRH